MSREDRDSYVSARRPDPRRAPTLDLLLLAVICLSVVLACVVGLLWFLFGR